MKKSRKKLFPYIKCNILLIFFILLILIQVSVNTTILTHTYIHEQTNSKAKTGRNKAA